MPDSSRRYLFNGDMVDRGSFSVENVLTLFAMTLVAPECVFVLRGNHETKWEWNNEILYYILKILFPFRSLHSNAKFSHDWLPFFVSVMARNMNSIYGFKGEVQHKYDDKVMSQFTKVFNLLPLAAVIQDKVRTERHFSTYADALAL